MSQDLGDASPTYHKTSRHKTSHDTRPPNIGPQMTQDLPYIRPTWVYSHHVSVLWACLVWAQTWQPDLGDARRALPKLGRQVWAQQAQRLYTHGGLM